jgi:hypothetical protein
MALLAGGHFVIGHILDAFEDAIIVLYGIEGSSVGFLGLVVDASELLHFFD